MYSLIYSKLCYFLNLWTSVVVSGFNLFLSELKKSLFCRNSTNKADDEDYLSIHDVKYV